MHRRRAETYLALCPYAPRVPYETWILPRNHDAAFERTGLNKPGLRTNLAALLRRTLQRVRSVTEDFHLVLHTAPSSLHPSKNLGYWKTIDEDYHWHIEILPILGSKSRVLHIQRGLLFPRQLRDRS